VAQPPSYTLQQTDSGDLVVALGGSWTLHSNAPAPDKIETAMDASVGRLAFASEELED